MALRRYYSVPYASKLGGAWEAGYPPGTVVEVLDEAWTLGRYGTDELRLELVRVGVPRPEASDLPLGSKLEFFVPVDDLVPAPPVGSLS